MNTTIPSLSKDDVATITGKIRLGAAWDTSARGHGGVIGRLSRRAGADLDALAVTFEDSEPVNMAGIGNNDPLKNGTLRHSGDNQTGKGEGDDETIDIDLDNIDPEVEKIVFMVAAFKKSNKNMGDQGFGGAENVVFTVYDMTSGRPEKQFRIKPSLLGTQNCCIVAVLTRAAYGWEMRKENVKVNVEHGNVQQLIHAAKNAAA